MGTDNVDFLISLLDAESTVLGQFGVSGENNLPGTLRTIADELDKLKDQYPDAYMIAMERYDQ